MVHLVAPFLSKWHSTANHQQQITNYDQRILWAIDLLAFSSTLLMPPLHPHVIKFVMKDTIIIIMSYWKCREILNDFPSLFKMWRKFKSKSSSSSSRVTFKSPNGEAIEEEEEESVGGRMIINVMRVVCRLQSTDSGGLRLRIGWDGLPLWR